MLGSQSELENAQKVDRKKKYSKASQGQRMPGSSMGQENARKIVRARGCLKTRQGYKMTKSSLGLVGARKCSETNQYQKIPEARQGEKMIERQSGIKTAQKFDRTRECSEAKQESFQKITKIIGTRESLKTHQGVIILLGSILTRCWTRSWTKLIGRASGREARTAHTQKLTQFDGMN